MTDVIGVIAEDDTDFQTIRVILRRILGTSIKVKKRVGSGCSHVRTKARAWIGELESEGCDAVILVHDLDRNPKNNALNSETALRQVLENACRPFDIITHICIPVEELEAWFWADESTVRQVGRGSGDAHPTPGNISKPKEALIRLSKGQNCKPRYTTNDNPGLAELLDFDACKRRCPSFADFMDFLNSLPAAAQDSRSVASPVRLIAP